MTPYRTWIHIYHIYDILDDGLDSTENTMTNYNGLHILYIYIYIYTLSGREPIEAFSWRSKTNRTETIIRATKNNINRVASWLCSRTLRINFHEMEEMPSMAWTWVMRKQVVSRMKIRMSRRSTWISREYWCKHVRRHGNIDTHFMICHTHSLSLSLVAT